MRGHESPILLNPVRSLALSLSYFRPIIVIPATGSLCATTKYAFPLGCPFSREAALDLRIRKPTPLGLPSAERVKSPLIEILSQFLPEVAGGQLPFRYTLDGTR